MIDMARGFDILMKIYVAIHNAASFNPLALDWMVDLRDDHSVSIDFGGERGLRVYTIRDATDYCRAEAILLEAFLEYDHISLAAGTMRDAVQN